MNTASLATTEIPSSPDIQEIIQKTPLFRGIRSRADVIQLATAARHRRFEAGDILYTPGPVYEIAIILAGAVGVRFEGDLEAHRLNAGSIIGEMEFFSPSPNAAWLVALGPVEVLCITHADLRCVVDDNPCTGVQLYSGFMSTVVEKLRNVTSAFVDVSHRGDAKHLAHDLRAPIAALRTLSASLSALSPHERETFGMVVDRMNRIAASATVPALSEGSVPTRDWLQPVLNEKRAQHLATQGLSISAIDGGYYGAYRGAVDATALGRIVSNLLDNSIDALRGAPGEVAVAHFESPEILRIDVSDDGPGMPQAVLEQLGTRPVTHGKPDGQGIGLFHAFRVIEGLGGQLVVCSGGQAGTVVSLRLYASGAE